MNIKINYIIILIIIYFSGIFNSKLYSFNNPDVKIMPRILHWFFFGRFENRVCGQSAIFNWLIPSILKNQLNYFIILKLLMYRNNYKRLKILSLKYNLNFDDYDYFRNIYLGNYKTSYEIIESKSDKLSNDVLFDGYYYFASKHMKMKGLKNIVNKTRITQGLTFNRTIKLHHLSQSIGLDSNIDARKVLEIILNNKTRYSITDQVFKANLVVFDTGSELSVELQKLGLYVVKPDICLRLDNLIISAEGFEELFNISTYNALHSEKLVYDTKNQEISRIADSFNPNYQKIKIRLLMTNYWVKPQSSDEVTGAVLDAHKKLLTHYLSKDKVIYPVISTPIYDITDEQNFEFDTLSYHTITRYIKPQKYIHYKESYLPEYFCFDELGYSGWSKLGSEEIDTKYLNNGNAEKFHALLFDKYVKKQITKYNYPINKSKKVSNYPNNYILAILQIPDDTVSTLSFLSVKNWLNTVYKFTKENNINLVVKLHPKDKSTHFLKIINSIKTDETLIITKDPIHAVISKSLAVITTNSGAGFEALLHHKPVITCGKSDYNSVAIVVRNETELESKLKFLILKKFKINRNMINNFLQVYCLNHCINTQDLDNFIKSNRIERARALELLI